MLLPVSGALRIVASSNVTAGLSPPPPSINLASWLVYNSKLDIPFWSTSVLYIRNEEMKAITCSNKD